MVWRWCNAGFRQWRRFEMSALWIVGHAGAKCTNPSAEKVVRLTSDAGTQLGAGMVQFASNELYLLKKGERSWRFVFMSKPA
jgi:hypothetical protein